MKTFAINKATGEKAEVEICDLNGVKSWITKESKQIICSLDTIPDNIQIVYDCTDEKAAFGKWLIASYKAKGWKKCKLCEAAGLTRKQILAIERGENGVHFDTIVKICNILGVEFRYPFLPEEEE